MQRQHSAVKKYHDRVAPLYDATYENDPYWQMVGEIAWRHIKRFLPADLAARCLDIGCGTGQWGLRLLRSGYKVDFLDISPKMLDEVAKRLQAMDRPWRFAKGWSVDTNMTADLPDAADKRCCLLIHLSLDDTSAFPQERYDFIIGEGDPLSCCQVPERTFKHLARLLKPGGVLALSVDNRLANADHYLEKGDLRALQRFLADGRTAWLTERPDERYSIFTFTPEQIRELCRQQRLELLSLIGKTVLPWRRFSKVLRDRANLRLAIQIEEALHDKEAMLGRASHLEFVACKPVGDAS